MTDPKLWNSWKEVPLTLRTGQVVALLGLDRRTLTKMAEAGQLERGLVAGGYRYGRAACREFAQRAGCDPFSTGALTPKPTHSGA